MIRKIALAACALAACLAHQPGTALGTYAVTGSLKAQTCGAGLQPDNPWSFDVRLSRSGSTLFWLQDSSPALSGTIDPSGNATFTTSEIFDLSEPDAGVAYCAVVRTDTFKAALGTTTDPSDFTGTIAYHYELDQGSSCGGLLAGQYDSIPCDVSYDLSAKRNSP